MCRTTSWSLPWRAVELIVPALPPQPQKNGLYPPTFTLFDEIVTNPAHFEPSGLLKLTRRVPPEGPQHGCKVGCSANMCKGGYKRRERGSERDEADFITPVTDVHTASMAHQATSLRHI